MAAINPRQGCVTQTGTKRGLMVRFPLPTFALEAYRRPMIRARAGTLVKHRRVEKPE